MGRYIVRRILWMIPVLLFISVVTFALVHAVPGGPFDREKPLPAEIQANLNKFYGLDQPIYKQYSDWMGLTRNPSGEYHGVLQGKFGPSYASRSRTVNDIFRDHLPVSAQLGLAALALLPLAQVYGGVDEGVVGRRGHPQRLAGTDLFQSITHSKVSLPHSGIDRTSWGGTISPLPCTATHIKENNMSKCRYCNSSSYGSGCSNSPTGKHEHTGDETRCEFCGSTLYGRSCSHSPTGYHRHGSGGNKCRWCGSRGTGVGGCSYTPSRNHER